MPSSEVTVAPVRTVGAVAAQISASPGPALARLTNLHLSPAPLTVAVCFPAPGGPSAATKATRVSPAEAVWKDLVVTVPRPWAPTCCWRTKHVMGGAGFVTVTGTAAAVPSTPLVFVDTADNVCGPSEADLVFHWTAYGPVWTGVPIGRPSRRNWTDFTPTLSLAVAATGIMPDTVWCAT